MSDIHTFNKKFLIGVLYRSPNSLADHRNYFCSHMEKVLENNLPYILLGDFNVIFLSEQSSQFKLILQKLGLTNLINEPTNFTTNLGTCIDLLTTNNTGLINQSFTSHPICSTHSITLLG